MVTVAPKLEASLHSPRQNEHCWFSDTTLDKTFTFWCVCEFTEIGSTPNLESNNKTKWKKDLLKSKEKPKINCKIWKYPTYIYMKSFSLWFYPELLKVQGTTLFPWSSKTQETVCVV